jgi:protein gp37
MEGIHQVWWLLSRPAWFCASQKMVLLALSALRDQCTRTQVPFFFKQWGEWQPGGGPGQIVLENTGSIQGKAVYMNREPAPMVRVGKKVAGRELDGREWNGVPGE